jgi:sugar porter (SP) family MFS transporter
MKLPFVVVKSTVVAALGGLLFGFDTSVISGSTAQLTRQFHLSAGALGVAVSSALWGTVIGALFAGIPGQRYGRRDSLRVMAGFYVVSALGCAFAWDLRSLLLLRLIGGLGIGGSSVLGPMYIAEMAPPQWRGRLVGFFQINIVVGVLLAYVSNGLIGLLHLGTNEWRWQLGAPAIPALLFLISLFGIPRSPRWLLMQSRPIEALRVFEMIGIENPRQEMEMIVSSLREEESFGNQDSLTSRKYRRPVVVAFTVGLFSQLTGINAVLYYLNDIFALAGASKISGNLQAIVIGVTILVSTLAAISIIDRFGRRRLLLVGTVGLIFCQSSIGYVFYTREHLNLLIWLLMGFTVCFAFSHGAVIWVYISEVFPTHLRARGQALGSSAHWISNAIISLIFPILAKHSGATPFFAFAAAMVADFFIVFFYYPETAGISLEKMQHAMNLDRPPWAR